MTWLECLFKNKKFSIFISSYLDGIGSVLVEYADSGGDLPLVELTDRKEFAF